MDSNSSKRSAQNEKNGTGGGQVKNANIGLNVEVDDLLHDKFKV